MIIISYFDKFNENSKMTIHEIYSIQ